METSIYAPAKLNLWLRLTGARRPDGRHELESHFAPLELADRLTLEPADTFGLSVSGPFSTGVPTDFRNLVWQAFDRFCDQYGVQPPLHIHIEKHIPHGAGLGGGSSDAGALLRYLAKQARVPMSDLVGWSLCLGADIPAAIKPHSGRVAGVGEILGERLPLPDQHVLLVKPTQSCPTGEVFQAWDKSKPLHPSRNDLETAALSVCPDIGTILGILRRDVDEEAQMTGSGSACFALIPHDWSMDDGLAELLAPFWVTTTRFAA